MAWLYKQSLRDAIGLTSLLIFVLLDEDAYKAQRKALLEYVKTLPPHSAKNDIGAKVHEALCKLAGNWNDRGMATGAMGLLIRAQQADAAKPGVPL